MSRNIKKDSFIFHIFGTVILAAGLFYVTGLHMAYGWFIMVNTLLFASFGLDKRAAQKQSKRRTPETTFLWLAFLGGFPALFIGRRVFRHKTVKKEFIWPMWALFILQVSLAVFVLNGFSFNL